MKKKNVVLCAIGVIIGILIFYFFGIIGYRCTIYQDSHNSGGLYCYAPDVSIEARYGYDLY